MPPEQEIRLIEDEISAILAGIQEALQSGERLDDDLQNAIADSLNAATMRLDQLRQEMGQMPPASALQAGDIEPAMPSSNVEGFAYDDKSGNLLVRFLGKHPDREGPIYSYEGVPKNIFEIFQKGGIPAKTNGKNKWGEWWEGKHPSMGAAMYHLIRAGNYPYQRLS